MAFVANAEVIARSAMAAINPALADKYASLIKLLSMNPEAASSMRGKSSPEPGTEAYIRAQAANFASARAPRAPEPPATIPDEMVSVILGNYFNVPTANLERAKQEHLLSMGAENLVGELLERYLASIMEPRGWIWCSGSTVKAVDLIKPPATPGGKWKLLQVKNRDNSETLRARPSEMGLTSRNGFEPSRRSRIELGRFSRRGNSPARSEAGFRQYVKAYLEALK